MTLLVTAINLSHAPAIQVTFTPSPGEPCQVWCAPPHLLEVQYLQVMLSVRIGTEYIFSWFMYSDRCVVISHCGFNSLNFWCLMMLNIFLSAIWYLYILFGKMSFFFFLLLSFKSSLSILNTILCHIWSLKIFSPSQYCIFRTIRCTPPQIWEANGGASYSLKNTVSCFLCSSSHGFAKNNFFKFLMSFNVSICPF